MNHDDERDHAEEETNRAAHEAEYGPEADAERTERIRHRLTFRPEPHGVRLIIDGTAHRILIDSPRRKRDLPPLITLLTHAADLGAVHGRCDHRAEIAAEIAGHSTPGHVVYGRSPDHAVTMHRDGTVTTLAVPAGLRPRYLIGQLTNALNTVFSLAGNLADEPESDTPPVEHDEPVPWTVQVIRDALDEANTSATTDQRALSG